MISLKPVSVDDAEVIFQSWGHYPENFAYLTVAVFHDLDAARRYLRDVLSTPESKAFHIVDADHGVIGIVKVAIEGHRARIGYVVHRPHSGRGIATEAVRQVVTIIEEMPNISRIWASCSLENVASCRVLEKAGFQREGILRNWVTYPARGGRAVDNYSYARIPRAHLRPLGPEPTGQITFSE